MHVELWASTTGGRPCYQTAVSDQQCNYNSGGLLSSQVVRADVLDGWRGLLLLECGWCTGRRVAIGLLAGGGIGAVRQGLPVRLIWLRRHGIHNALQCIMTIIIIVSC